MEKGLANAVFLRCGIKYINEYFEANEIDEIWLPFPDPFPKRHNALKRLSSLSFLQIYKSILKTGGVIHLKTDDLGMYKYTLAMLKADNCVIHESTENLHGDFLVSKIANDINGQIENDAVAIQTKFELQALAENKTIKYVRFGFAGGNDSGNSPKIG
jgi:tRNA (guanine-N7-)-methyltransferase